MFCKTRRTTSVCGFPAQNCVSNRRNATCRLDPKARKRVMADERPNEGIIHEIIGAGGIKVVGVAKNYTEEEHRSYVE